MRCSLEVELGTLPVPSLSIVANPVACPEAHPLWHGAVLLLLLSKLLLDTECLVGRYGLVFPSSLKTKR